MTFVDLEPNPARESGKAEVELELVQRRIDGADANMCWGTLSFNASSVLSPSARIEDPSGESAMGREDLAFEEEDE